MDDRSTTGLILVDHGSKRQAANDMLYDVVALFKKVSGYAIVEPAHMELEDPSIEQAFEACVAAGATRVIIHPYFLAPGRHSSSDIPRMAEEAASHHPGIPYQLTPPLGVDEKIVQLIIERVESCMDKAHEADRLAAVA